MGVVLKSAFQPVDRADGARYFVETLWPEGVDTCAITPYKWVHELAPSYYMKEIASEKKWDQIRFKEEYLKELRQPERNTWFQRVVKEATDGTVTLLYGSRKKTRLINGEDTTAYYLKEFVENALDPESQGEKCKVEKEVDLGQWSDEGGAVCSSNLNDS